MSGTEPRCQSAKTPGAQSKSTASKSIVVHPREILNRLKWHERKLGEAIITIVHRGAPGDLKRIKGELIKELGKGFMAVEQPEGEVYIPYHRIVKIEVKNRTIWERK